VLRFVFRNISPGFRLEVIAKISLVLVSNLFGGRFLAVLRIRRIVLDAHLAYMQFGVAGLANLKAAQRQTKRRERRTAAPAD
jgi:hypothetical protein